MKKFIFSTIVLFLFLGCGDTNTTSNNLSQNNNSEESLSTYPDNQSNTDNIEDTQESNISTVEINETTPLTSSILLTTLEKIGYSSTTLNLQSPLRGEVDYQTYLYLSNQYSTIALLGNYVYALQNNQGRRILFTVDGSSEFDSIEKSSELILRANFIDKLRYLLPFAPTGYLNINTTATNPNATVGTLMQELTYAFNQFTLTNPHLTQNQLSYRTDSNAQNGSITCNNQTFELLSNLQSIDISGYFENEEWIHCRTQSGVLIGSIYTPQDNHNDTTPEQNSTTHDKNSSADATVISGELIKVITTSTPQVEGSLSINKEELEFIATEINGSYGEFTIDSLGQWKYMLIDSIIIAQPVVESFEIEISDASKAKVEITIQPIYINQGEMLEGVDSITGILSLDENKSFDFEPILGEYGTLQFDTTLRSTTIHWIYRLNNELPIIKELKHGHTLVETFVIDANTTIEITIWGQDTTVMGTLYGEVTEFFQTTTGGIVTLEYSNNASLIPQSVQGEYGNFSLDASGSWNYNLDNRLDSVLRLNIDSKVDEKFTIETSDGASETTNVTIHGTNSIIGGKLSGIASTASNVIVNGLVYVEHGINQFNPNQMDGNYGFFQLDSNGSWRYELNLDNLEVQSLDAFSKLYDEFNITAIDGTSELIGIDIVGQNITLEVFSQAFDALLTQIESMNLQDYNITFPKVTANGDSVKISYKFNGNIVAEGSSIILNGSQNNLLEVLVQEQGGDQEEQNLSKTIQLVDTIAPLPPFIDHPLSTALTQVDVLVTAFEDNVDLYLNGTLIDTIVDSTQSQSVTLNTNITAGLLNFDFTLKDAQGNESNLTTIEIQKINPNSPTDFSDVVIQNINVDGSLTGAKLSGNIVDADGISQVVITYQGDPNQDIFASGNINGAREKTFGTNYTIEVTDGKGVISTKSGTITEQNEPMQLLSVSLFDNKIMMLEVKDLNRIQSVSISYPSGESSLGSPYDGFGSTTFYSSTLSEPILSYPFTYTITVRDLLGNDESYTRTVIAPVESDFTNVVIGNNLTNTPPDASGYLAGSIKDPNGIKDIYISYGDGSNDTLAGNGATEVFLSALSPHDHNTTFNISVTDMDGGFSSTSGVIAP